jgi:hypothetical protein
MMRSALMRVFHLKKMINMKLCLDRKIIVEQLYE